MASSIELLTSLDTFHNLHLLADGRDGKVRVDKTQLRRLLIDHTCMLKELQQHSVKVTTEPPKRRRESISEE